MIRRHEDGIYFGMPADQYHEDDALGSGDHKVLLANPVRWWWKSPHATDLREALTLEKELEEATLAQKFGEAVHTVALEGVEAFEARYWVKPDPPDGLLVTRDDMRDAIREMTGRSPFGQLSHAELVLECRKLPPAVGVLVGDWQAQLLQDRLDRIEISRRWQTIMTLIARMIDTPRPDYGGKSQREHILSRGMPEVSVFYTDENGVRLKARFDWLRIKALVDLKTFSSRDDEETISAFCRSMENFAYDLQAAHYMELRAQLPRMITLGQVYTLSGPEPSPKWLRDLAAYDGPVAWSWLTVQTVGMPETDVLEHGAVMVAASAGYQLIEARRKYLEFRDRFGLTEPWVSTRGTVVIGDDVLEAQGRTRRMTARGEETWKL